MAANRKPPRLRTRRVNGSDYYATDIYRPDGKRVSINFGPVDGRPASEVQLAFAHWLKLLENNPHKTLSYQSPYGAVAEMIEPRSIVVTGQYLEQYRKWAEQNFMQTRTGQTSPNFRRLVFAQRFFKPYAQWPIANFGPDELKAVRDAMTAHRYHQPHAKTEKQLTRISINLMLQEVRRMFSWGVARNIIAASQERLLNEIKGLSYGDSGTKEGVKRSRVTEDEFNKVVAAVSPTIGDMMRTMWLAVLRPSEVCVMRGYDFLKDDGDCWLYIPGRDKTPLGEHKLLRYEKVRCIPITASLQKILGPRIHAASDPMAHIFSPKTAVDEITTKKWAGRQTPLSCGNRPGTHRVEHPMIKPGARYTPDSFRQAIARGCGRAAVIPFSPYDLRRSTSTRVEAVLDRASAQHLLGHAKGSRATELYMLEPVQRAMEAAKRLEAASA